MWRFRYLRRISSVSSGFVRVRRAKKTKTNIRKVRNISLLVGRNNLFVQLPVHPVASFPRVAEVSFVSSGIRSSRSCKPDSEFGGRSANPSFSFWHGTLSLTAGPFGSRSSRSCIRLLKKYEAAYRVSPAMRMVRDVYIETNLSQYAFAGFWLLEFNVTSLRPPLYIGSRAESCASWAGKCRRWRLTTIIRNSYMNGLRHCERSL